MIKDYRLTFTFAHVGKVIGVNSHGRDDLHIIMWDFDDITLKEVTYHLKKIQWQYSLSDIYLLKTKEPDNYIAYCFTLRPWREVVAIVVRTEGVDWQFIRFGVYRGRFTLRVTAKGDRIPYRIARLKGYQQADIKPSELKSWVRYETLVKR